MQSSIEIVCDYVRVTVDCNIIFFADGPAYFRWRWGSGVDKIDGLWYLLGHGLNQSGLFFDEQKRHQKRDDRDD